METFIIKINNCKREDINEFINELEKLHKKVLKNKQTDDIKLIIKSIVDLQDSLRCDRYVCELAYIKFFN